MATNISGGEEQIGSEEEEEEENNNKNKNNNDDDDKDNNKRSRSRRSTRTREYRKEREEWSDEGIEKLLEAYTEKFIGLNRGNLRVRDWEDVSDAVGSDLVHPPHLLVSSSCPRKTVEQCKNKVDNLKKRYKLERHRISNGGVAVTHWPWFKKMEVVVGNGTGKAAAGSGEDDKAVTVSSSSVSVKQSKRYGGAVALSPGVQINNNLKSKTQITPRWRRVVLKISGAALAGASPHNIDPKVAMLIAREVSAACRLGVEVAIVVGGRNFFCGNTWVTATGLDRCTAYQIGMMATVMNSILLQSALEKMGIQTRVQTAFAMPEVAEPYCRQKAIRHLEKGRVVIFGGIGAGTGNPLFSTDTAAALRASEIHADAVLKGTNIDGIYLCDSRNNNVISEHISFRELASRGSSPMDVMAVTYCEENGIPVLVFNLHGPGNISRALCGEQVGTLIDQTGRVG